MNDVIKCIAGLVFLLFELKQFSVSSEKIGVCNMRIIRVDGTILMANCNASGITSIPQYLPSDISALDISFNNITTLETSSLKNYPYLRWLAMRDLPLTKFPRKFFKHTPLLVKLNISNTQITNWNEIPRSIEVLNFTNNKFEYIDLSHLVNLRQLFMRQSASLKSIPKLYKYAPLEVIDLKFCPLIEAHYSQIAPYCHLRYFGCNSTELRDEKYLQKCCEFKVWCFAAKIKSGYMLQGCNHTGANFLSCKNVHSPISKEAKEEHNACFHRETIKVLILVVLGVFLFILCVALLVVIVYHLYVVGTFATFFANEERSGSESSSTMEIESETDTGREDG